MFGDGEIDACAQRKAVLLRQSAVHRQALVQEAQNLQPVVAWVDLGIDIARKARTALSALAPLFSLWQMRKQESSGFLAKLTDAIAIGRSLTELWKNWR